MTYAKFKSTRQKSEAPALNKIARCDQVRMSAERDRAAYLLVGASVSLDGEVCTWPVNGDPRLRNIRRDEESSREPNRPRVRRDFNYGDAPHLLHQMHRTELRGPTNRGRLGGTRAGHTLRYTVVLRATRAHRESCASRIDEREEIDANR